MQYAWGHACYMDTNTREKSVSSKPSYTGPCRTFDLVLITTILRVLVWPPILLVKLLRPLARCALVRCVRVTRVVMVPLLLLLMGLLMGCLLLNDLVTRP